jgi:sporulation protein YlmC with PRC-barrel domain
MKSSTIIASLTVVTLGMVAPAHGFADNVSMFQQDPSKHHHYDNPAPEMASYDSSTYSATTPGGTYYTTTTTTSAGATGASAESNMAGGPGTTVPVRSKSSGLVGKRVENQQGDKLGKIRDVVVAQQPGNQAFVVIEKAHHPRGTSRDVALPITAIQSSPDMAHVTAPVDKYQFDNMR